MLKPKTKYTANEKATEKADKADKAEKADKADKADKAKKPKNGKKTPGYKQWLAVITSWDEDQLQYAIRHSLDTLQGDADRRVAVWDEYCRMFKNILHNSEQEWLRFLYGGSSSYPEKKTTPRRTTK